MSSTIVVGVDDSDGARAALTWAASQAQASGAHLRVVHAYELNLAWIDADSSHIPLWLERAQHASNDLLERLVEEAAANLDRTAIEMLAVEGAPAAVLFEQARDASLLVVGSRGRGGFASLLLGSVSQQLAQHSPCPLVIVPRL